MPKKRLSKELWDAKRIQVWERDNHLCIHCKENVAIYECHIDHIRSGKLGANNLINLRTLCRKCHVLRADKRHRGMISYALKNNIIPPNWRELIWDDE
jgi:5-methylcytosine-specific restriction endonuclease McrA